MVKLQRVQKSREATFNEQIASLQSMRKNLIGKKELVERQIEDLDAKVKERKNKGIDDKKA
jgi:hypothetical protein